MSNYDLKFAVFEDKANGYPIGEYKTRGNRVADIETCKVEDVDVFMKELLSKYNSKTDITLEDIVRFHSEYEKIHPFQDENDTLVKNATYSRNSYNLRFSN